MAEVTAKGELAAVSFPELLYGSHREQHLVQSALGQEFNAERVDAKP